MNEPGSIKTSKTDWARVDAMTDDDIDFSDNPELTEEFFARATWRNREPMSVTLSVDPVVLAWYQSHGDGWERHVQAALKEYLRTHVADE